jgi:leucyl aminopeptidase (aminopeptidase T)
VPDNDDNSKPPLSRTTRPPKSDDEAPTTPVPSTAFRRSTQRMAAVPASQRAPSGPVSRSLAGHASLRRSSPILRLSPEDFDLVNAARRILEGSLSLVPGETVLVIVDRPRADLVPSLAEVANVCGARCEVAVLDDIALRPLREVPKALEEKLARAQATVLLVGFVEGEHTMRLELLERVRELGLRHAHMVGVTRRAMLAGFSVDPTRILDATRSVRTRLRPKSVIHAKTGAGTDVTVKLDPSHRWAEHVGVIRPGRWENLPSGELMTSPESVDGVFVCDATAGGAFGAAAGVLTRTPLRLEIEGGIVKSVSCSDSSVQRGVEAFLALDRYSSRVGTIVLGTNVGLLAPIGELVCDQNLPGLHLTLGSTFPDVTGAPATTTAQLSLTSSGGDVDLDGAPLIRAGRYMV